MKVYSAVSAPLMDGEGKEVYVIEARLEKFKMYVDELVSLLSNKELVQVASSVIRNSPNTNGLVKLIKLMNDLIVIYFRRTFTSPLTPPPRKPSAYAFTPQDLFYVYIIAEDLGLLEEEAAKDFLSTPLTKLDSRLISDFIEAVFKLLGDTFTRVFAAKRLREVYEEFRDIVMSVPADTRPGLNISKLLPHLLMTSAIASSIYLSTHCRKKEKLSIEGQLHLEILRMASLLHDIGKPESWLSSIPHPKASAKIAQEILEAIKKCLLLAGISNRSEVMKLFNAATKAILEVIENHHRPSNVSEDIIVNDIRIRVRELVKVMNEADRASSMSERLTKEVARIMVEEERVIGKGISEEELIRYLKGVGREVREFWERNFSESEIRELSDKVARRLSKEVITFTRVPERVSNVKMAGFDVRGIQKFIRRESLRAVIAASLIIDLLVLYAIPRSLRVAVGVPPESVVMAGGGMLLAIVPSWVDEPILNDVVRELRTGVDVKIKCATTDFLSPWILTQRTLSCKLKARKLYVERKKLRLSDAILGYEVLCESCGRRPATTKDPHGRMLCNECSDLLEFGRKVYIRYKIRLLRDLGYIKEEYRDRDIESIYRNLMEWLSGSMDYTRRGKYISVIKMDGNSIGSYMARAITPADAYLRSARIDLGAKLGVQAFLESLASLGSKVAIVDNLSSDEAVVRTYCGILYVGGDDLLAIIPSSMALPLSLSVAYWFWRLTGVRTMSAGIACGKPKHNVWLLIDTANQLLKKAKQRFRQELRQEGRIESLLHVGLELGTQQVLPSMIDEAKAVYGATGLMRMPSRVPLRTKKHHSDSIPLALKLITGNEVSDVTSERSFTDLIKGLMTPNVPDLIMIRGSVAEILTQILGSLKSENLDFIWASLATRLSYIASKRGRTDAEVYRLLALEMLHERESTGKVLLPPLRDLLMIFNIMLGGG